MLTQEHIRYIAARAHVSEEEAARFDDWAICRRIGGDASPIATEILQGLLGRPIFRCPTKGSATRTPKPKAVHKTAVRRDPRRLTYVAPNPKRSGSAARTRYGFYKVGDTLDEAMAKGVTRADIRWDLKQGFIRAE